MYVPSSHRRSTTNNNDVPSESYSDGDGRHLESDELMFELDDISMFCPTKTSEIRELALDVVSKMVESWLDPNNILGEQVCQCQGDTMNNFGNFPGNFNVILDGNKDSQSGNSNKETMGPSLDEHRAISTGNSLIVNQSDISPKKPDAKRSNGVQDGNPSGIDGNPGNFDGNSKEKRPRCNTGDKTASKSSDNFQGNPTVTREVPKEYFDLVALHLPIILRLCFACPFGKMREKCRRILEVVQGRGLPIPFPRIFGPSGFVPSSEVSLLYYAVSLIRG